MASSQILSDHWPLTAIHCYLHADFGGDLLSDERFNDVADLNIAVVLDADAAFHAITDFADILLETPQRGDLAFEDHHVVPQQPDFGIALERTVLHVAAGNSADF